MEKRGDKNDSIRQIREVLSALPGVRIAYLYGSFLSRDDFRDIDVALLIDDTTGTDRETAFASHAGTLLEDALGFSHECDVRILNRAPVWFAYEIISTGMPLFIRNEDDRNTFETQVLVEYQDVKFMYDLFDREYLARV